MLGTRLRRARIFMFIEKLKHLLDNFDSEYSKNEWVIPEFIEKYILTMPADNAYEHIGVVVNILLEKKYINIWTEIFSILISLVRKANTTEIPENLNNNLTKIKENSKNMSIYDYNQFLELTAFYRIDDNDDRYDFHITTMPTTRLADFYLGCLDDSVFIDFSYNKNKLIELKRISFDGYGCCNIVKESKPLNENDSKIFIKMFMENNIDQDEMAKIVRKVLKDNIDLLWQDALEEYDLI
jgi:hypothetical protein